MAFGGWKRGLTVLALVIVGALLGWWLFHPRPSDRELIEDLVAKAEHGVETKSSKEIMECVAPDYRDEGGLTRVDIFRLAWRWQRTSEQADVVIDNYEIEVTPPTATGRFDVQVLLEEQGRQALPLRFHLMVQFEKQRQRWRKVWLVKSVGGHGLEKDLEDLI
jgi:hypothetical protein